MVTQQVGSYSPCFGSRQIQPKESACDTAQNNQIVLIDLFKTNTETLNKLVANQGAYIKQLEERNSQNRVAIQQLVQSNLQLKERNSQLEERNSQNFGVIKNLLEQIQKFYDLSQSIKSIQTNVEKIEQLLE